MSALDLVGETEIAGRAGVKAQTVYVWRRRHADFPAPDVDLAMGPVWRWERVAGWSSTRAAPRPPRPGSYEPDPNSATVRNAPRWQEVPSRRVDGL